MSEINVQPTQREQQRMQSGCEELVDIILRAVPKDGGAEPIQGLHLFRFSKPFHRFYNNVRPSLCLIAQGSKDIYVGNSRYHQFKAVTAMSPLQFQKQIRLQEARQLMLSEGLDAANAGYQVGYRDASHFNREYKKFFGAPPLRDVQQMRDELKKISG